MSYVINILFIVIFFIFSCHDSVELQGNTSVRGATSSLMRHGNVENLRKDALVLIHAPGMGFAQTNPYETTTDRPRTGLYPVQCDGAFPANGHDARKTNFWLWLDNASPITLGGPLPDDVPAPSFGHLCRRLEDAGYSSIKISYDKNTLSQMIKQKPQVIITASKGIAEAIEVMNANDFEGSALLINGATLPIDTTGVINAKLRSLILTHGSKDTHNSGHRTDEQNLKKLMAQNIPYFIYENKHDGHNPRSLAFPSTTEMKTNSWPDNCSRPSPSWPYNNSPGGNHRIDARDSYLINLLDAIILDNSNWPKNLIPLLDKDSNISKTWL